MAKKIIDEAFEAVYKAIIIQYPFCYKTKDEKNYFRYLEDGRFEFICIENKFVTLQFGTRCDTIECLQEENNSTFKTLASKNIIITNEDFEEIRNIYFEQYKNYLLGTSYLAKEVQDLIDKGIFKKENNEQAPENYQF